jgi:hypothetical protein
MFRRLGLVVFASLPTTAALLTPQLVTATHSAPATVDDSPLESAVDRFVVPYYVLADETNEDEATDLYGNRVSTAVATYELDATGVPYERHSPQTQLPRLGSPKS